MGADWPQFLRIASEVYRSRCKAYPNHIIFTTGADWPKFLQIASRVYRSQRKSYPNKEPTYTNTAPVLIKELERQTYLEAINQQDKWNKLVDQYYSNSFTTKCSGPFIIPLLLGINNLPLCIEFQNFLTKMHVCNRLTLFYIFLTTIRNVSQKLLDMKALKWRGIITLLKSFHMHF